MTSSFSGFLLRSRASKPVLRLRQSRIILLGSLVALAGCGSASRGVIQTAKTVTSVALSPSSANIAVGATQQFKATVTYSDGTTADVSTSAGWAVASSAVATVDGNGLVKGVAAGTTTVTAVLNGVTGSASVTVTAQAPTVKSITVAPANLSVTVGATQQYQASATFSDGSVKDVTASTTWTSSNPTVATINASGVATAIAAGSTTITAAAENLTATTTLTVTSTTPPGATLSSIAITPANPTIAVGATQQFTATGTYSDGTKANITATATWTSSSTAVATINAAGLATGVTAGSATITAAMNGVTATAALTISSTTPPPATLSSIAVTPPSGTVAPGATQQFTATASYSDGSTANVTSTATWVSANAKVATVNAGGLATGVAAGSTTITATLQGVSGTATLTVSTSTATLSSIAVTPANPSIAQGATQQFTATATYSDGTTGNVTSAATWSSSDSKVATINTAGLATGAGTGTATISATLNGVTGSTGITVTSKTVTSIAVTPSTASFSAGNTQQFKATATYADSTTGDVTSSVTWTSSDTSVVTINASGLAMGVASGSATITATLNSTSGTASVTVTTAGPASTTNIPTWHVNNSRTGLNSNETALTPSTVNASKFGKLWSYVVDGYVYGEPLVISNLTINGATHNVVFAATEADSVYAFDLDSSSQTPLWKTSLLQSGETPLPSGVIQPYAGVTSTPVIDTSTNTMYLVSVQKGSSGGTFRLNALDITTGNPKQAAVTITASVPGTATGGSTVTLTTGCMQRAALLLANGNVYIGVGGCPTGWLLAYNASTLAQVAVWNASPNQGGEGKYASAGGVWMGSGGPVADSSGNIYVTTGNGPWNGSTSLSDSVVKFDASLHVLDYFTPQDWAYLFCDDTDLAAGGLMMIPGTSQLVAGGKAGKIFVVNSDNLGHEQANDAGATQSLWFESDLSAPYSATCTDATGSHTTMINSYEIFGTSAWYNGSAYLGIIPTASSTPAPIRQFAWDGSKLTPGAYSSPNATTTSLGTTPFISSNGNSNGIVWMINQGVPLQKGTPTNATLYAYDATNFPNQLYNSNQSSGDTPGYGIKFTSPVVANGKVFISTAMDPVSATNPRGEIDVYGLK